jgi:P-type Cu2+ transporter
MSTEEAIAAKSKETKYRKDTFPVLEMTCAACAISVESILKSTEGVKDAAVNFANQTAWVEYDSHRAQPADLRNAVQAIGYDLVVDVEDPEAIQQEAARQYYSEIKERTLWSSILAFPVVIMGMFFMDFSYGKYISLVFTAPIFFCECLEAGPPRESQYGYARRVVYWHCFSFQRVQHLLSRILAFKRDPSACIL